MFDDVEEVVQQEPAYVLSASRACGRPDETAVSWSELRREPVGAVWNAAGGGSLFSHSVQATLVYRDDKQAVLMVTDCYWDENRGHERSSRLIGFKFDD